MRQDYVQLAEPYRRHRTLHPLVLQHLLAQIEPSAPTHVVEIGCGLGNYIRAIAESTSAVCTGIDSSREMLRIARANPTLPNQRRGTDARNVTFLQGTAENLPLPDGLHRLAFSVDVIHHVRDRDRAAGELHRMVEPGGVAVVVTESEDDLRNRTPQVTYFPETVEVELVRNPRLDTIEAELASAGFDILDRTYVSMPQQVSEIAPFRDKAFSSLHLIPNDAFDQGLARMHEAFGQGPIGGVRRYTIVAA